MSQGLTDREREGLDRLIGMLLYLHGRNELLTVRQLGTLLFVARNPGLSMTEIARLSEQTLATVSRHVQALKTIIQGQPSGSAWVDSLPVRDARLRPLWLTNEGQQIVNHMLAALDNPAEVNSP
jgi:DNA-binding MarR family transcriptional regulator